MQAVILAGGFGTRISEYSINLPKPLIEIGGFPILWHVMKILGANGVTDFIICGGYKVQKLKEYFSNFRLLNSDFEISLSDGSVRFLSELSEDWTIKVVDTGLNTQTGGRLKRVSHLLDDRFLFTYGDGVCDLKAPNLIASHEKFGGKVTVTGVSPESRFGSLSISGSRVLKFVEKPSCSNSWVSGGFFCCEKSIVNQIYGDEDVFEKDVLPRLSEQGEFHVYKHDGFWSCMDTVRDREFLENLWNSEEAPWKIW